LDKILPVISNQPTAMSHRGTVTNPSTHAAETDLPVRTKVFYGIGGMCDSIKQTSQGLYLLFFYTTVLGLPGRLVGAAAMLGLIWDASIDPLIGRRSDQTLGRLGRRHGWMIAGIVGMVLGFIGLFSSPTQLSRVAPFAWLLAMSLLLRTGQSMFGVPYLALGAELGTGYDKRTSVAAYRVVAAQLGALAASSLALSLFFPASEGVGSRLDADSYSRMAVALGTLMGIAGVLVVLGTWTHRHDTRAAGRDVRESGWWPIVGNRAFVVLTLSTSLFFLASVISIVLSLHFLTHYAGIQQGWQLGLNQLALHLGAVAGVVVWIRRAKVHDKQHLFCISSTVAAMAAAAGFWVAQLDGPFEAFRYPLIVIGHGIIGAAGSGVAVLAPSMLADVAEEHRLVVGDRREGAFFGAFSAGQQVSLGLGTAVAGLLLDYYAGLTPGAATQTEQTVTRLGVLATLLPGALMVMAGLFILRYGLTRARVDAVQQALAATRERGLAQEPVPSDSGRVAIMP
jgi:GPH family glycoside/pentoside/hexuronide:cation symporter